jgi:hypothetical protein
LPLTTSKSPELVEMEAPELSQLDQIVVSRVRTRYKAGPKKMTREIEELTIDKKIIMIIKSAKAHQPTLLSGMRPVTKPHWGLPRRL